MNYYRFGPVIGIVFGILVGIYSSMPASEFWKGISTGVISLVGTIVFFWVIVVGIPLVAEFFRGSRKNNGDNKQ